jgi:hypothetical protein
MKRYYLIRMSVCSLLLLGSALAQTHADLGELRDCPKDDKVWFSSVMGTIRINPVKQIEIIDNIKIKWVVPTGEMVNIGQVLGVKDPEGVEHSEKNLKLKKAHLEKTRREGRWDLLEKRKSLRESIAKLQLQLEKMQMTAEEKKWLGNDFEKRLKSDREEVHLQIKDLQEKLKCGHLEDDIAGELGKAELDVLKAEKEHQNLIRNSEILSPVAGQFYLKEVVENVVLRRPSWVGEVVENGVAQVEFNLADPRLAAEDPKNLRVAVTDQGGEVYEGEYSQMLKSVNGLGEGMNYQFRLLPTAGGKAFTGSVMGPRMIKVYRKLSEPGHMVLKQGLLFKHAKEITEVGWKRFIESRWVGAKVTFIAPKVVVVIPPK